ncbi:MAG: imidazole glycerol phosphate synthase subunit HisH [Kiritimatiellae bacterium]|jgi:glutamine amidotransferase|nr:imidazole glycerol phosphate synthase subunit HisH [Kiritimatiellia bacterium]NLF99818.1 imidazole glycerol phosphate synthase subunit HisH [Lentisphaerota bacterium]
MLAIVDYKAGNLTSVQLAFGALGCDAAVTSDPAVIRAAERVVFPGVGAAGAAMAHLDALGLAPALRDVTARGIPFLGICLGTQILFDTSEEDGGTVTLGLLPGRAVRFRPSDRRDKVPQIGWNQVKAARPHPLLSGIADESEFYFVHSYYPAPDAPSLTLGTTCYAGVTFSSMVARGNVAATQFHPEKSGRIGLRLLENFLRWTPDI